MAILWLNLVLIIVPVFGLIILGLAAAFVQVNPVSHSQVASLNLPDCLVEENMERMHG